MLNADLIAVSFSCPKDPKSPYSRGLLELVVSETSWRKYLGDLRDIAILVQYKLCHFWHLLIYTKPGQTVSDYHPASSIFDFEYIYLLFKKLKNLFLDVYAVSPVFPKSFKYFHQIFREPATNLLQFFWNFWENSKPIMQNEVG